jgi:hypothetical protein
MVGDSLLKFLLEIHRSLILTENPGDDLAADVPGWQPPRR